MNEETSIEVKPSKRELFKKAHGFSKTRFNLLKKHKLFISYGKEDLKNSNIKYKTLNKDRRLEKKKVRQNKHQNAKMNRKTSTKKK